MKKVITSGSVVLAICVLLAGCGKQSKKNNGQETEPATQNENLQ